jgi:ABC-2 type transport system permease protein
MTGTQRLTAATTKMEVRSREVIGQVLGPLGLLVLLALLQQLDFRIGAEGVSVLDFMATGMGVLAVTLGNTHTFLATVATYKSTGVLKRVAVTPMSRAALVIAEVAPRVLTGLLGILVFLAAGAALGADIRFTAHIWGVLPVAVMATVTGLSWAFVVAGVTRNPQNANALDTFVMMPLFLFSGAMFPLSAFPGWLERLAEFVPYAGLLQTVRGIALGGEPITSFGPELAVGAGWIAVLLAVAVRTYRFTE